MNWWTLCEIQSEIIRWEKYYCVNTCNTIYYVCFWSWYIWCNCTIINYITYVQKTCRILYCAGAGLEVAKVRYSASSLLQSRGFSAYSSEGRGHDETVTTLTKMIHAMYENRARSSINFYLELKLARMSLFCWGGLVTLLLWSFRSVTNLSWNVYITNTQNEDFVEGMMSNLMPTDKSKAGSVRFHLEHCVGIHKHLQ